MVIPVVYKIEKLFHIENFYKFKKYVPNNFIDMNIINDNQFNPKNL